MIEQSRAEEITAVFNGIRDLVLEKNKRYGDSALSPIHVFNKLDAESSIRIRLDDKLGRVKNSDELRQNDISDCVGYLALLCVEKGWTNWQQFID